MNQPVKTLDTLKVGTECVIKRVHDSNLKIQTLRFGLTEGERICCKAIIPAGPVVVGVNQQEIALGRNLAKQIEVEVVPNAPLP